MNIIDDPTNLNICLFDSIDFYFYSLRHKYFGPGKKQMGESKWMWYQCYWEYIYFFLKAPLLFTAWKIKTRDWGVSLLIHSRAKWLPGFNPNMQWMGWIQKSGGNFTNRFQKLRWITLPPWTEIPPANATRLQMQPGLENRPSQDLHQT